MPATNNVTRMLASKGIPFEAHELPAEKLGGLEAAAYLGIAPSHMYKTIVAVPDGGKPVLALVPAAAELDLKSLGRALAKKVQLASQTRAEKLTGLQVGGISPLALIGKGFDTIIDESAMDVEKIYISGGQRGLNVSLSPRDIQKLTNAKVLSIVSF